jgi:hypothetical protein
MENKNWDLNGKFYAKVNDWLYIGNIVSCKREQVKCDNYIHIYRSDFCPPSFNGKPETCENFEREGRNLVLDYRDNEPLTDELKTQIKDFVADMKGTCFIHCHAGRCRAPSIGAYVLHLVSGLDIFDSICQVSKANWYERECFVSIGPRYLQSVLPF